MNALSETFSLSLATAILAAGILAPAATAQTTAEDLRLTVGKSVVIDYPSDVRQISTSDPGIVDANPVTTREILLHGKGLGNATMIVWSKDGQRTFYNVTVEANLEPLRRLIKETFPLEDIKVQSSRDSLSLTGRVSGPGVSERAAAMSAPFVKTVINNLQLVVPPVDKQIMLKVKFASLDRTRGKQFAVNFTSGSFGNTVANGTAGTRSISTAGTPDAPSFTISDAFNIFAFRKDLNLGAFVKALESESILEVLAEPNLVTTNGKEASFLVGGEFPVPVLQGGANAGAVTVMFREFGIRLRFTPVITENKTIKLHLNQEVSDIDLSHSVSVSGFTIPGLSTRKTETDVELAQGQSFAVAGLLNSQEKESYSKIPGLASLPIFGNLFKTKDVSSNRTELILIVTPEITVPASGPDQIPMPYFPKDFLVPINAPPVKSSSVAPSPKADTAKHWYSLHKSN